MAAKLQCEICGGKLVGKPGGVFECEFCGTEYSTEWAKAKIQEITGTVKVEGTVDVKGSVQVEGTANAQSLIKRGNLALEDEKWDEASNYFNEALNADPENAEAYLGLLLAQRRFCNKEEFAPKYIIGRIDADDKNLKRSKQFAGIELSGWFDELDKKQAEEQAKEQARFEENKKRLLPVREQISKYRNLISAGDYHTVGLKEDGTVVATKNSGSFNKGQCDVASWTDIVAVSAGSYHTVGLKGDGTVVATKCSGSFNKGQYYVAGWKDIVAVSAGSYHTVGLKADGTVVATGDYSSGQRDVESWTDIVAVSAGDFYTVGLKADGTVIAVGSNKYGQCDVSSWTDIVAVSAGTSHTVGLKADGTVVATKYTGSQEYYNGRCDVENWTDIVAIAAGESHTVGLKSDGTVVSTELSKSYYNNKGQCNVSDWTDIVAVFAGYYHTVGLKADGTVVAIGQTYDGQCDVSDWKLFKSEAEKGSVYTRACALQKSGKESNLAEAASLFSNLRDYKDSADRAAVCRQTYKERKAEREERIRAQREKELEKGRQDSLASLNSEKSILQTELSNLKGIFSGKRRKEIEARLAQIENELKSL